MSMLSVSVRAGGLGRGLAGRPWQPAQPSSSIVDLTGFHAAAARRRLTSGPGFRIVSGSERLSWPGACFMRTPRIWC